MSNVHASPRNTFPFNVSVLWHRAGSGTYRRRSGKPPLVSCSVTRSVLYQHGDEIRGAALGGEWGAGQWGGHLSAGGVPL